MQHRHLTTRHWTPATVDSALDRGDLPDWRDLFTAARADRELATLVRHVARHRIPDGASMLALSLVERWHSGLGELSFPGPK